MRGYILNHIYKATAVSSKLHFVKKTESQGNDQKHIDSENTVIRTKLNLYYTRGITAKRVTSGGAHRGIRSCAWATQLRRNVAAVASRWRHCADLTGLGIKSQTSRTDSMCAKFLVLYALLLWVGQCFELYSFNKLLSFNKQLSERPVVNNTRFLNITNRFFLYHAVVMYISFFFSMSGVWCFLS